MIENRTDSGFKAEEVSPPKNAILRFFWGATKKGMRYNEARLRTLQAESNRKEILETIPEHAQLIRDFMATTEDKLAVIQYRAWDKRSAIRNYSELILSHLGATSQLAEEVEDDPNKLMSFESDFWKPEEEVLSHEKNIGTIYRLAEPLDGLDITLAFSLGLPGGGSSVGTLLVGHEGTAHDAVNDARDILNEQYRLDRHTRRLNSILEG